MNCRDYFPMWDKLTSAQQEKIELSAQVRTFKKGDLVHNGMSDCSGLYLIISGQLRSFMYSSEGREITISRLFERDICLFSAPCIMKSLQFDLAIEAEKETAVLVIPPDVYRSIMEESAPLSNYTNEIMASNFSEVMWLIEQIMWNSLDKRIAGFLLEESLLEGTDCLNITHETISNHLGSAREVVTRMLRYFQSEGMVKLSRGTVTLLDVKKLEALRDGA